MPDEMIKDQKDDIIELFGSKVFNITVMRKRLPGHIYKSMMRTIKDDLPLESEVAEVVANAMKDWAMELGATHFTHWFQPMTGITAEKHDAFISPTDEGKVIMEFSGKELIKGEPDASSFPSGGLRATFEARGYTAWDPTSFAFVKGTTLYIPTTFVSYSGEVLDKKTPLLRSMKAVSDEAVRILKLFGKTDVKKVTTTVGAEQEYFLIDREMYKQRQDLIMTGRTLFGSNAPKGQDMSNHYFGRLRTRVYNFMCDVDHELWSLGIPSKTRHNEVAPAQHELAPVFSTTNLATDNNQVIMETLIRVAKRHHLACLLHAKPFKGVNGSGKHDNWAMSTDTGENLFDPGKDPANNLQFLTFLIAVIEGIDRYPEILRSTVASAGNDHRLGGDEAPPAIISIFLGDQLDSALKQLAGEDVKSPHNHIMDTGIESVPNFVSDATDRNRTSPFAFTGNRFEFRMVGSQQSIAGPNIALNTIAAQVLGEYADILESSDDFERELKALLRDRLAKHRRIIFNGNNYSEEWVAEAARRGLPNLADTPAAFADYCLPKNLDLMEKHDIYSRKEMQARQEIHLEEYAHTISIEARTMLSIAKREIVPACLDYMRDLSTGLTQKKTLGLPVDHAAEMTILTKASNLTDQMIAKIDTLEALNYEADALSDEQAAADFYGTKVLGAMNTLREIADQLEIIVGKKYWPYPIYQDLLFYV
ncbi:glutamine synthetase III family protein [Pseudoramibacter alactolyticus]|uniref:glutamine synthetase III family protein n=1 Tax=Pseudoramibacter alactolyticus TaxID=113287 RepID=UPI0023547644|nr:glutamine synthetase III [Pseudoramibacter alactolyticus]MBM6967786.1 glutamine synthetase III [Pseudoramibacter alactolyticus]